jgi:lipoate-protein ligase A
MARFLDRARNDEAEQTSRALFAQLAVCHDETPRSAAVNMSIDEALLEMVMTPTIRFYGWRSPALSFGYFGKFCDVASHAAERDLVRRWTGGGIVFHGDDLTYSIVIPARTSVFRESSGWIYEKIHGALVKALIQMGQSASVVPTGRKDPAPHSETTKLVGAGIIDVSYSCFANPVRADVMINGRKIAGAAQRRTRRGLLQQGSIQGFPVKTDLAQKFAQALSANCTESEVDEQILKRAQELSRQKYGTDSWLRKR